MVKIKIEYLEEMTGKFDAFKVVILSMIRDVKAILSLGAVKNIFQAKRAVM